MKQHLRLLIPIITTLLLTAGCSNGDERLARFAEQATQRQAEQNRQMAELQRQVAEGSRKLVEANAEARAEFAKLGRELQSERSEIGAQRTPSKASGERSPARELVTPSLPPLS